MSKTWVSILMLFTSALIAVSALSAAYIPPVEVETVLIKTGNFADVIRLVGTIDYSDEQLCVIPFSGKVAQVYVEIGQKVKKGDLLFRLDTTEVEVMLAAFTKQKNEWNVLVQRSETVPSSIGLMQLQEAQQLHQNLIKQIACAQIRANMDGRVEQISIGEGEYLSASGVAGRIVSSEKKVRVADRSLSVQKSAPALISHKGQQIGTVRYVRDEVFHENMIQNRELIFEADDNCLELMDGGERVNITLLNGNCSEEVIVPLEAIGTDNRIWFVENEQAWSAEIDISRRNELYVAVNPKWKEKHVILYPDLYHLSEGCMVRENML